jgi:hypothetical protein
LFTLALIAGKGGIIALFSLRLRRLPATDTDQQTPG